MLVVKAKIEDRNEEFAIERQRLLWQEAELDDWDTFASKGIPDEATLGLELGEVKEPPKPEPEPQQQEI